MSVFKNLILVLAAICIALLVGEAILHTHYYFQNNQWYWNENNAFKIEYSTAVDDRREYRLRPKYVNEKSGLTINSEGFRITPVQKNINQFMIILGDSVPFGAGVRDNETYPYFLANKLSTQGWNVINAGISSYNLRQSFDRLRLDVIPLYGLSKIKLLTIEAANDISLLTYFCSKWTPDVTWAIVSHFISKPKTKWITFHYLSQFLRKNEKAFKGYYSECMDNKTKLAMFNNIKNVLRSELSFYERNSISIVLMPINPFYYQLSNQAKNQSLKNWERFQVYVKQWGWAKLVEEYNELLLKISEEFGNTLFFDTRIIMDAQDRDKMYIDFIHHSPLGNKIRANSLITFLIESKLITDVTQRAF